MNPDSIRQLLARQPFEIRMSNGDTYQVRHPENLALGGSRIAVSDPATDQMDILALIHINRYRMLRSVAS